MRLVHTTWANYVHPHRCYTHNKYGNPADTKYCIILGIVFGISCNEKYVLEDEQYQILQHMSAARGITHGTLHLLPGNHTGLECFNYTMLYTIVSNV